MQGLEKRYIIDRGKCTKVLNPCKEVNAVVLEFDDPIAAVGIMAFAEAARKAGYTQLFADLEKKLAENGHTAVSNMDTYQRLAVRTETVLASDYKFDLKKLWILLQPVASTGKILTALKKRIFYKADVKPNEMIDMVEQTCAEWCELANDPMENEKDWTSPFNSRILHSVSGIVTETAEIAEIFVRVLVNKEGFTDAHKQKLILEWGDLLWYVAIGLDALGVEASEVWTKNIAKLKARFPESYADDLALNRNEEAEEKAVKDTDG